MAGSFYKTSQGQAVSAPTPPSDAPVSTEEPKRKEPTLSHDGADFEDFSEEEAEMLMKWGEDILSIPPESADEAWEAWTKGIEVSIEYFPHHFELYCLDPIT